MADKPEATLVKLNSWSATDKKILTSSKYKKAEDSDSQVYNNNPVQPDSKPPGARNESIPGGGVDILHAVKLLSKF